ncbi:MAG TPA: hypothetical protein VMV49_09050 [Candidatus Deferrimicrobium sp.]|nr:hypothetical protein [Candidatus Deferrimicrobium sp.]
MGNLIENESALILQEYSTDYNEDKPADIKIYLSITPEIHYSIQINFETYPEKPKLILPSQLHEDLGEPESLLHVLHNWNPQNPSHVVEIIHELEEFLQRIIHPTDEMEEITMEFNAHMIGPHKMQVTLFSYKMKVFEFQISQNKPDPPLLILSHELEKIIKPNELYTLQNWQNYRLIDICRELSKKIDHRTRILDELKLLEKRTEYQKIIKKWNAQELIIGIRIEIETGENCEIDVIILEEFPVAPPNVELINTSMGEISDDFNNFLLSIYNEWVNANTLVEMLDDIRNFLKSKSKHICQICHEYKCPKCNKPIRILKVVGISGENECKHQCNSCNSMFHNCCWSEQTKLTRKCPICYISLSSGW